MQFIKTLSPDHATYYSVEQAIGSPTAAPGAAASPTSPASRGPLLLSRQPSLNSASLADEATGHAADFSHHVRKSLQHGCQALLFHQFEGNPDADCQHEEAEVRTSRAGRR
jgi:hypothetical protein